jgi:RNA polymerase sigma factor (sigma-70 family)
VARERNDTALQDFRTLFTEGVGTGLTDGQLLERFTTRRGEAAELAFATLVERHGPMVLRACRGILRDDHDAQDAFQATFLTLVRSGPTLWVRDSLGPWLHRVACRAAVRAKRSTDRRKAAERRAAETETAARAVGSTGRDDLGGVLHEEIDRLPDRQRIPVVLCDLEGRTYEEAARHLGCPVGTVKSRLARGRERLRGELARRGFAPSDGVLAAVLSPGLAATASPRTVLESVAQATLRVVSGKAQAAGAVPEAVLGLTNGVLRSMALARLKRVVALVLVVSGIGIGIGAGWVAARAPRIARVFGEPIRRGERGPEAPTTEEADQVTAEPGGRAAAEERDLSPFDEIRVDGRFKVVVAPGPEYRLVAIGDDNLRRALRTRVEKRSKHDRLVLQVTTPAVRRGDGRAVGQDALEVRVTLPRLSGVIAEGLATVEIRGVKNEPLTLTVRDSAKINASGTTDNVTAVLEDDGELNASRLLVEVASVTASGRSSGVFHPRKSLNLMASGDARVEYLGTPSQINKITSDRSRLILH